MGRSSIKFAKAQEVELIAKRLIPTIHPHLQEFAFAALFRDKPQLKRGKRTAATFEVVSAKYKHLTNLDFLIIVDEEIWERLSKPQKEALVDHELCHGMIDGKLGKLVTRGHDIEEFFEIAERHGAWSDEIHAMEKALDSHKVSKEDKMEVSQAA